jgi:hypothetical protein
MEAPLFNTCPVPHGETCPTATTRPAQASAAQQSVIL